MTDNVDDFLMHFGVKGMRWGVVNEDPVGAKTVTRAESKQASRNVKAKKKEDQAAVLDSQIKALRTNRKSSSYQIEAYRQERDRNLDDAKRIRDGRMTNRQKQLVVGASIAVGIMAAYGLYRFHDSGQMGQSIIRGREFLTGQKHEWKINKDLARKNMSPNELMHKVVSPINPHYGAYGTKNNCRRATFAYEMRRRGYDVKATLSNSGAGQSQLGVVNALNPNSNLPTHGFRVFRDEVLATNARDKKLLYESPIQAAKQFGLGKVQIALYPTDNGANYLSRVIKPKSQSIYDALNTQPNGARGELSMAWKMGGAHSMVWEKINGKAHIFDTQSGEHFGTPEAFNKLAETIDKAGFTRLDNVKLNEDFLQRWVTNV